MPGPSGKSCRRWLFVLILALTFAGLRANESDSAWMVRVWKMSEGLAGTYVSGVVETDDGFLWVVAGGELARFDGDRFTRFPVEGFAPPQMKVREFLRSADGGLALALFDGRLIQAKAGKIAVSPVTLPHDQVRLEALSEDGAGGFLLVYNDESVWRVRGDRLVRLSDEDGLPPGAHCRFVRDRGGQIWFAKGQYVGVMRGDVFEVVQRFPASTITRVAAARDGGVWIGAGARLFHLAPGGALREIADVPVSGIPVRPTFLLEDRSGAVWFGTYASGLFRFEGGRVDSVPISHRQVVSLTEDREGSLWVATSGGGLNQVQPRTIAIEGGETGVPYEAVQTIVEDLHGQLWGLTHNGLVVARRHRGWTRVDGLEPDGEVSCLALEPSGALWMGTKTGALHCWDGGRLRTWTRDDGIATSRFQTLVYSRSGALWLGGSRPASVQRWHEGKLQTFELPRSANELRAMTEDAAGNLWIATTGRQLVRIRPDQQMIDETNTIASIGNVRVLRAAPDGSLWLSLDQAGIGRLKDGALRRVTSEHGLLTDAVELMMPDGRGWWWFAGVETIFKVSEEKLLGVLEGRLKQFQPVRYGYEEGIRPVFGATVGALRRDDGKLWIPLATSLAIIDPSRDRGVADPPPVWITELKVDDHIVATHEGVLPARSSPAVERTAVVLDAAHRRVDFHFTAPSYRAPLNVMFRYRLEPFEDAWVEAGARRTASYSRLAAGDYRFRVIACNGDGIWNDAGATLAVTIAPFFWETWWFRATVIVVFTAAVLALTRYVSHRRLRRRLRAAEQETAVERERARIARDIHDDLGSRLTKIMLLGALVKRDRAAPEKAAERIDEITETAQQVIKSLDETVWAVDPRNDNLPEIIGYIAQFAESFLRTAEIECELDLPADPSPEFSSTPMFRHELFLAVKEALTNIVRHAQATRVSLRIETRAGELEILIADNGRGMEGVRSDAHADGLRNMRQRLEQIGGAFAIESGAETGTTVRLTAPWPPRG